MHGLRTLFLAGVLALTVTAVSSAQTPTTAVPTHLAALIGVNAPTQLGPAAPAASLLPNLGFRAGVMFSPRGAGLAGLDFGLPSLSLLHGCEGRLDADVIFKANFGGINTIMPVTLDQIFMSPMAGTKTAYLGAGVGAILSGPAKFNLKAILGMDLTGKASIEANAHFTEHVTLLTAVLRSRL